jgi:O-antigen/teichoic acid export membrane protein
MHGPKSKPISFQIVRSVIFSMVRKIVLGPVSLLLVPFTLHRIGVSGYGTWAILLTVISMSALMDPGLSPAITKFVAEHNGTGEFPRIREVLDASFAVCLVMSAVAVCTLWIWSRAIIGQLFHGPGAPSTSEILALWPFVLVSIFAGLMSIPFRAAINGLQRMDITNILLFSSELISVSLTVILLLAGAKVRGLLIAELVASLFILSGSILVLRRLLPAMTPNPFHCELPTLRKIGSFSMTLYAGYIMTTLQGQLEKLYLARFVGVVPVGWYSMASQAASKVQRVPDLLLGPVLAAASELDAAKEQEKVNELHFRAQKYLAFASVPLVVFALFTAKSLVTLWVGPHLELIAFPFALLVLANFFPQMGAPTYFIMVGRGILRPAVYTALMASVLNVILSIFFIRRWGFPGAVWGTALPMFISTVYFFVTCKPHFKNSLYLTLRRAYLKPLLCAFVAASVIPLIGVMGLGIWQGLVVKIIAYGLIYLTGLAVTRFFDSFDFTKAQNHLPLSRLARRIAPVA